MPKQTVEKTNQDRPKGYMDNFTIIHDQAIQQWVCEEIIEDFHALPLVEMIDEGNSSYLPKEKQYRDKNHRYEAQGRVHANIYPSPLFAKTIDSIHFALPKGQDFESISYMQIIHYPENSYFDWHMDEADSKDTGTTILFLNDDFLGRELTVNGTTVATKVGTIVGFKKSTTTWHSVAPVLRGDRYCLAIWYCNEEDNNYAS